MNTAIKQTMTVEEQVYEFAKCQMDIFAWLNHVKIKNETTNELIEWQEWPHLKLLIKSIQTYKLVVLLKSRQLGCSWAAAAYHLWLCYKPYTNILCFSKGEKEAAELLDKSRFINNHLPDWLKLKVSHDGAEYINFADTKSRIMALPSTKSAGIGYTATHITADEKEFHEFAEENDAQIMPAVNAGGSKLDMSSPSPDAQSYFKTQFRKALIGENNYHPLFFPYYVRPGQDAEWYMRTRKDYWPQWKFLKAHPRNLNDALGAVEGEGLFDSAAIDKCIEQVGTPLETRANSTYIFRHPKPGIKYYAGGDGAEGRGGNNSVIFILGADGFDKELVAIMRTNQMTPDIFAFHAYSLLCEYGRPLLVMGADPWSQMILDNLVALGYRDKIYCSDKKRIKLGLTEDEANKQQKLMQFALEVRNGLRIRDKQTIDEMSGWVLTVSKESGRSRYVSTYPTDDCIIAGANALLSMEYTPKDVEIAVGNYF